MPDNKNIILFPKRIATLGSAATVMLGLIVLFGWYTHNEVLIQVHPAFVPMQYNTALGFFLGGTGLMALILERQRLAAVFGWSLLAIGLLTLCEYIFNVDIGLDQLFMKHYITTETSHPGRMAPNTALCFSLSSMAILAFVHLAQWRQHMRITSLLSALTVGLGAVAFFGYLSSLETAYGWANLTRMAVHTAAGFMILGCGVFAFSWKQSIIQLQDEPRWLATPLGVSAVTIIIILWQAFPKNAPKSLTISVLFVGLLMAFFLTLSAHLAQSAQISNRSLTRAVEELEMSAQQAQLNFQIAEENALEVSQTKDALQTAVDDFSLFLASVALGDLTSQLLPESYTSSELQTLSNNLNAMVSKLREMTLQISNANSDIANLVSGVMSSISEQIATTRQQAAAVAQTSTTVEEARQTAEQSTEQAKQVADMAEESLKAAGQGLGAVQASVGSMSDIKEQVNAIAENILSLSEQTQQIGEIISTVNDIADQSNLLALNAAIEAARAGEAGKGFAVVAGEVRNLAKQSRAATDQVRQILSEIQKAANTAVMVTEEGTKRAELGATQIGLTGEAIQAIRKQVEQVAQAAQQIAVSAQQQLAGMDQIGGAMQNIDQATIQTQAGTQQVENAAANLNDLAAQLSKLVGQYKVTAMSDEDI